MSTQVDKLLRHTERRNGCLVWLRYRDRDGYGRTGLGGRRGEPAHRAAYRLARREVPAGFHIHHTCETPACVDPAHLVPMSPRDHGRLQERSHCVRGHRFDKRNTYRTPDGRKACRRCNVIRSAAYRHRKRGS